MPRLVDNQMQYAIVRLAVSKDPDTGKVKTRDIFISWVGPRVGTIDKGKKKAHLGTVMEVLKPSHQTVYAYGRNNFNEEKLIEVSQPSAAEHVID